MRKLVVPTCLLLALSLAAAPARASDHADPLSLKTLEPGLAGLFVFPNAAGDRLEVILTTRRGLSSPGPYEGLELWEFTIWVDTPRFVTYHEPENVARYGGSIGQPESIDPDFWVTFRLKSDASSQDGYPQAPRLKGVVTETGVFDDPFIFPRFAKTNVIAMAASIPMEAFPQGTKDFLFWATSTRISDGEQIDHVGRANRTQLGRLDFLNTLPPNRHLPAIEEKIALGQKVRRNFMKLMNFFLPVGGVSGLFQYVLQVRKYDAFPDVMIYTTRRPPGFPNGRRLEDDIAGLTCEQGDCVLQEVASIEGEWPRLKVNYDREFGDQFPYLAEAWPATGKAPPAAARWGEYVKLVPFLLLILLVAWYFRWRRKQIESWEPEVNQ